MRAPLLCLLIACGGPTSDAIPAPARPAAPTSQAVAEYSGRFASDPRLKAEDVAVLPPDRYRLLRNEIYARYGRTFQSSDLQAHFEAQPWYHADPGYSDTRLTANDKANAALIQSFEEGGQDPLEAGQFPGAPGLIFLDAQTVAVLAEFSGDLYEQKQENHRWERHGEWILTWAGTASHWDPMGQGISDPSLWKLDYADPRVVSVTHLYLPPPHG
jgi:hypothetical protein